MPDFFAVGKVNAILVPADASNQKKIVNNYGGKLYYKTASDVDTGDTELAVGSSITVDANNWIISETESKVSVERLSAPTYQDLSVTDDLTVTDSLTVSGTTTPTGGVVPISGSNFSAWTGGFAPAAKTSGTDVAFAEKKLFLSTIFLPAKKKIKGIGFLLGTEGGTNKVVAGLFNSSGEVLAKTTETTEGTTAGTKETIQEIDLTSEYSAVGPATYFIGITANGNTAKLRTITIGGKNSATGEVELAEKNKLAKVTAPTTFTADKGPVAFVY